VGKKFGALPNTKSLTQPTGKRRRTGGEGTREKDGPIILDGRRKITGE